MARTTKAKTPRKATKASKKPSKPRSKKKRTPTADRLPRPGSDVEWRFKADFLLTQITIDILTKGQARLSDYDWITKEENAFRAVVKHATDLGCTELMIDVMVNDETGEKELWFSASDKAGLRS